MKSNIILHIIEYTFWSTQTAIIHVWSNISRTSTKSTDTIRPNCNTIQTIIFKSTWYTRIQGLWRARLPARLLRYTFYTFTALHALGSWLPVNAICWCWGNFYDEFAPYAMQAPPLKTEDELVKGLQNLIIMWVSLPAFWKSGLINTTF